MQLAMQRQQRLVAAGDALVPFRHGGATCRDLLHEGVELGLLRRAGRCGRGGGEARLGIRHAGLARDQFAGNGSAVLYRTCFSAKLERIFSIPGMGVSCSRMKRSSAAMSATATRIR